MELPQMLNVYFSLQKQLFDYFGYREDWRVIPLDNQTGLYWMLVPHPDTTPEDLAEGKFSGWYVYSDDPLTQESILAGTKIYSGDVIDQRHQRQETEVDMKVEAMRESGPGLEGDGRLYTQRFLPKWVYRGPAHTLVCADTRTDGNKLLMVFDNDKECTDEKLRKLYLNRWGRWGC